MLTIESVSDFTPEINVGSLNDFRGNLLEIFWMLLPCKANSCFIFTSIESTFAS